MEHRLPRPHDRAARATGYPVLDADIARLSPYMRRQINFHGHYSFAPTNLGGTRRKLRLLPVERTADLTSRSVGGASSAEHETLGDLVEDLAAAAGVEGVIDVEALGELTGLEVRRLLDRPSREADRRSNALAVRQ